MAIPHSAQQGGRSREPGASPRQLLAQLAHCLRNHLRYQALVGLEWLPRRTELTGQDRLLDTLEQIRADLGDCRRCRLHRGRTHIVFGEGSPSARVVIVGEGPGHEEDLQGRPFVGAAGKLLSQIIVASGWRREDIYICNVLKCRPPKNRDPEEDEIASCGSFLKRQIKAIRPQAILTLGSFASQFLLSSLIPISALRGGIHKFEGIPLVPTYHPAYLLRNPLQKRRVWQDIQLLQKVISSKRP